MLILYIETEVAPHRALRKKLFLFFYFFIFCSILARCRSDMSERGDPDVFAFVHLAATSTDEGSAEKP
jgi:hypothetical protein